MVALLRPSFLFLCLLLQTCAKEPQLRYLGEDAIILTFGDSLTYGTGASPDKSYPAQLEKLINRKVINAGVPGEISSKGLSRLPGLLTRHEPDLVILCHGANDILRKMDMQKTRTNLLKMITMIKDSGAEVVLLAVPDFNLLLSAAPLYGEIAKTHDIPLLEDTLSGILLRPSLKSDHVHPNAEGYLSIARKIEHLLESNGGLRHSSN